MSNNTIPLRARGAGVSKFAGLLMIAVAVTLIVKDPVDAASWARELAKFLGHVINSLDTFLRTTLNH